jgi:hypothetical protein
MVLIGWWWWCDGGRWVGCRHHDVLSRILFLFAKLNPGIRYVQGMNELLAPIYYVFARETDPQQNCMLSPNLTLIYCSFFFFTSQPLSLVDLCGAVAVLWAVPCAVFWGVQCTPKPTRSSALLW